MTSRTATERLAASIAGNCPKDGVHETAIPRLHLIRLGGPSAPTPVMHSPSLCVIAQGRKRVWMGERVYEYDAARFLTVSFEVPMVGQVIEASETEPYLCFRLDIDPAALGRLILEAGLTDGGDDAVESGVMLSDVTPELGDAAARMVDLLAAPRDAAILAPMVEREILYRLLTGQHAAVLHRIARSGSRMGGVARAVRWIGRHYDRAFTIEEVAREAGMSASALHQHFRTVTAMSPLQYQKRLRLQEARRLILFERCDAATAGHRVGYDSPSQFSREYSRLYGLPPRRDIERLRASGEMLETV